MACVLRIVTDDQGFGDWACQGHPDILSPNVDALAAAGTRFTNFRVPKPMCSPTRATLKTGHPPEWMWVNEADNLTKAKRMWLPSGAVTVERMLKTISPTPPRTCHVGKWHLGVTGDNRHTLLPTSFGIDRFYGNVHGFPNSAWEVYAGYFDTWLLDLPGGGLTHQQTSGYLTDVDAAFILGWLDENGTAPEGWFLDWWPSVPHLPLDSAVPQGSLYPAPTYNDGERAYYGSISNLDHNIGLILAKFAELELDVHIIITSDNGPAPTSAEHPDQVGSTGGMRGFKHTLYEGGLRVPMIWNGPGIPSGVVDTDHRLCIDIFPTLLGLYGIDASAWPGADMFSAAPLRDMLFTHLGPDDGAKRVMIRLVDGVPIKVLRFQDAVSDDSDDRFYDITNPDGEANVNRLTVVASDPGPGELLQSVAESMSDGLTALATSLPAPDLVDSPVYEPLDETDARLFIEQMLQLEPGPYDYVVHMCGTTGSALNTALSALMGLPNDVTCAHHTAPLETALGTLQTGSHPIFGASTLVPPLVFAECFNVASLANCSAPQRAEIMARLAETSTKHDL